MVDSTYCYFFEMVSIDIVGATSSISQNIDYLIKPPEVATFIARRWSYLGWKWKQT